MKDKQDKHNNGKSAAAMAAAGGDDKAADSAAAADGGDVLDHVARSLGMALQAMAKSPQYAGKTVKAAYESLLPAVATRQFRIVRGDEGEALAFVSWAMIGEKTEKKLAGGETLGLADWQSGDKGLLVDVVAMNGRAATALAHKVKRDLFADKTLLGMAVDKDGKTEMREVPAAKAK